MVIQAILSTTREDRYCALVGDGVAASAGKRDALDAAGAEGVDLRQIDFQPDLPASDAAWRTAALATARQHDGGRA